MKYAMIIGSMVLLLISCSANKQQGMSGMPPCMITKIDSMKSDPKVNSPQAVTRYTYKGNAVFYITSGCCD